jgi:NAD(P)-dependent dehydrogenase (short-subunit alcohol dehydrogenase family)
MASAELAGKRVLVTGGSSGIGLATAEMMAASGARVAVNGRQADRVRAVVASLGPENLSVPGDVGQVADAERIVADALSAFGGLDIVVNAAGVCVPCALADLTPDVFSGHIQVNLVGSYVVGRAAGLAMAAAGGGSIVNVGSELSHFGMPFYVHYCASKAGVLGLTRAMAAELAPEVRVNAVCPGPVDTPMLEAEIQWFGGSDRVRREAYERVPLKRLATPEEVARAIVFLSTDATYATGSVFSLDGGTTAI